MFSAIRYGWFIQTHIPSFPAFEPLFPALLLHALTRLFYLHTRFLSLLPNVLQIGCLKR
jgi:hypothetical protein